MSLAVSECFGPTIQGEGPSCGRRAVFVRLGGCNLACSWCDTPYSWDWTGKIGPAYDPRKELTRRTGEDVAAEVLDRLAGSGMLVVTGGEPMLQQPGMVPLVRRVSDLGHRVEVETNGTIPPGVVLPYVSRFNVSPKLDNSGNGPERFNARTLRAFAETGRAVFKFVAVEPGDLDEIEDVRAALDLPPRLLWVMAEGKTQIDQETRLPALADAVIARGWNLSPRLHVAVWGNRRGV